MIVLNFEELGYMNSGGIGLLVTILIRAQRKNQRLAAFGLTDHYREIFSLTRLDEAITILRRRGRQSLALGRLKGQTMTRSETDQIQESDHPGPRDRSKACRTSTMTTGRATGSPRGRPGAGRSQRLPGPGPPTDRTPTGIRPDVAEDLQGRDPGQDPPAGDQHLEGRVWPLLAREHPLLRPRHRHQAGRDRSDQVDPGRPLPSPPASWSSTPTMSPSRT